MMTLDDFSFLPITFFTQRLDAIRVVLVDEVSPKWGNCSVRVGPLRMPFKGAPKPGGAHDVDSVFFTTSAAPGYTILLANLEDGWSSLGFAISKHLPGRVFQCALATLDEEYPMNAIYILEDGKNIRCVRAMKDYPRWDFFETGERQPFENPAYYTRRYIRDRLNREIMVEYLEKLGIHIRDPLFWQAEGNALHFRRTKPRRHAPSAHGQTA